MLTLSLPWFFAAVAIVLGWMFFMWSSNGPLNCTIKVILLALTVWSLFLLYPHIA